MILINLLVRSRVFFPTGAIALLLVSSALRCAAQDPPSQNDVLPQQQSNGAPKPSPEDRTKTSTPPSAPAPTTSPDDATKITKPADAPDDSTGKQSKRILLIFPNYRAVSADTKLPPLSLREKAWLATQDSFDYSSFVTAGLLAGVADAKKSTPEFGHGGAAFGRYYWHAVADQAVGNYMTEAIFPAVTHEDPRYYTLGHGGPIKRTAYAIKQLLITRTDSGGHSFNFSEIVGNGAGAGISDAYYPGQERTWTKTGQKWITQIALDGAFNILKEFWPDINKHVFHDKY